MKSIIKQALAFLLPVFLLAGCDLAGQERVRGSGHVIKENRKVDNFREVKVEGSINVTVTQGTLQDAVIEAEDNIAPLVELIQEGDDIVVRYRRGYNIRTTKSSHVYLTVPELTKLSVAGSGDLTAAGKFSSDQAISLSVAGSGNIKGAMLDAPAVKGSIAGSGNISVGGESRDVNVKIAGSGNYYGDDLMAENAAVNITGSGNAAVHASINLDAKITGSGDIKYKGAPQVSSKITGSGSVRKS